MSSFQATVENEAVPVAFRYQLSPLQSFRTNVFKPNPLSGEAKAVSIGALWSGKCDQIPQSKIVSLLWEAGFEIVICHPAQCEQIRSFQFSCMLR